jgi:Uncharacterized protein conserved in bacteria (DUF2252)
MAARTRVPHLSVDERRARGKEVRNRTAPSSHAGWTPSAGRPDPIGLLEEQDATREPDLVPVRHGRMLVSPFTFYRGAAKLMAADLNDTPTAGLHVQLCGDAHLSNFGAFASPERRLLFGLNDFDETLPGPFEYDVKRMAASFTIAGRNNGFATADTKAATLASVAAYREAMTGFAAMGTMDIWYAHRDEDQVRQVLDDAAADPSRTKKGAKAARQAEKTARKEAAKARTRDSLQGLSKLAELVSSQYRIVSRPPVIVRDAGLQRPAPGSRPGRPAVPAAEGGQRLGPGGPPAGQPVPAPWGAGGLWPADDAGRQRHLPGLDAGQAPRPPPFLLAPAARHEGLTRRRGHGPGHPGLLRPRLRVDAGASPCPLGRPHRHRRLPR